MNLREALESAASAAEAPAPEAAPTTEATAAPEAAETTATEAPTASGPSRDESGRFAPKAVTPTATKAPVTATTSTTTAPPAPTEALPATSATESAPTEDLKPPASWRLGVREKWGALPPEVRAEVVRREREIDASLKDSAPHRKLAQEFQQVVSPYMGMLQAEGSEPLKAVASLLQTAAALRTAPTSHKAQLVAGIMQTYGVSEDALVAALSGTPQPQQGPQHATQDPQAFAQQAWQHMQQMQQQAEQQAAMQRTQAELSAFEASHEFFGAVQEEMHAVLQAASARRSKITIEEAYTRACKLNPEVASVLQQRESKAAEAASNAEAAKRRAAGSSIKTQPSTSPQGKPQSLRAALEAAAGADSGR